LGLKLCSFDETQSIEETVAVFARLLRGTDLVETKNNIVQLT
jgi:hypothetical protein